MSRIRSGLILTVTVSLGAISIAMAQDEQRPPSSRRTFGDRIDKFRQELIGDDQTDTSQNQNQNQNQNGGNRSNQQRQNKSRQQNQSQNQPQKQSSNQQNPSASSAQGQPTPAKPLATKPAVRTDDDDFSMVANPSSSAASPSAAAAAGLPSSRRSANKSINKAPRELSTLGEEDEPAAAPAKAPRVARSEGNPARPISKSLDKSTDKSTETPRSSDEPRDITRNESRSASRGGESEAVLTSARGAMIGVEATGLRRVTIGKEAVFYVKVRNGGDVAARNVVVNVELPHHVELSSVQPSAGAAQEADGGVYEWKLPKLEARARETLTIKLIPRKSESIELGLNWSCAPESLHASVDVQEPKLAMSISGPSEVLYGQSKVYKLTLNNPGNGDAENVRLTLSPLSRGEDRGASQTIGLLRAGESKTIDVELTARESGELAIKAQATGDGGLKASVEEPVLVRRADLQLAVGAPKMKFAGALAEYHVTISNAGNASAENVRVSAVLPPEAKYGTCSGGGQVSGNGRSVSWVIGSIRPGVEKKFDLKCTLSAAGANPLKVTTVGDADLTATETAMTQVEALADLKLEIHDPQGPAPVGEDAVYEVVIRNRGTKAAEEVNLTLFFSEGMEATKADGGAHQIGAGQVKFQPLATLPANSEATFHVRVRADRAGSHIFRAEVNCPSVDVKLAGEQTTRFYSDESTGEAAAAHNDDESSYRPAKDDDSSYQPSSVPKRLKATDEDDNP